MDGESIDFDIEAEELEVAGELEVAEEPGLASWAATLYPLSRGIIQCNRSFACL